MPIFFYKAIDNLGSDTQGKIEASSETSAFKLLKSKQLSPYNISPVSGHEFSLAFPKTIKPKDLSRYIRQLSTLLGAGVSLLEALESLSKSNAHPALAKASNDIRKQLRAGGRLSTAMETHLSLLPKYVPRLAELGEATGQSAKALADAADRMEFDDTIRTEIRTALSYPIFLATVGILIVFLMFLFVVPRFATLIGSNEDKLPTISRLVINTGSYMSDHMTGVLLGIAACMGLVIYALRNKALKRRLRSFVESLPLIGSVFIQGELGGWARTVGIALDNGADLLAALQLGEYGVNSDRLRRGFVRTRTEIRAGRNIDEVLDESIPDFDPLTIDLIRTGRSSGKLADMLLFIGSTQEGETRETAKRLASIAEPIAILLISLVVGTVVISIVLAMTSLYDFAI